MAKVIRLYGGWQTNEDKATVLKAKAIAFAGFGLAMTEDSNRTHPRVAPLFSARCLTAPANSNRPYRNHRRENQRVG